ncbi:hypothetical protein KCG43_18785 [Photobacterium sp. WH24]|uniref:DUF4231 domain-containing protein n=1 Tax=Photobacterium arenosum TaxID=2774143 RepID=A0ABR9BGF5_9GAMM|nr:MULTISPECIES: hypothetical protein [Photobacterium]MBD8511629.1 hypothetical protein [Photobacterium arenosum]MBV7264061.1 hypothetical protein [Photobacterium sp. WH24]
MASAQDFSISRQYFIYKADEYTLSRIKNARVKVNTLKDHLFRVIIIGMIVSSVIGLMEPAGIAWIFMPFGFITGALSALATARKYELQIEFEHTDETGLQWISVVKGHKQTDMAIFSEQADQLKQQIA